MPEGPEVKIIADELDSIVSGKWITSIFIGPRAKISGFNSQSISPSYKILGIKSHGKRIIFNLNGNVFLVSFLAMEGKWCFQPGNHSHLGFEISDDITDSESKISKIDLKKEGLQVFKEGLKLYFDDTRYFGYNKLFNLNELNTYLSSLGPDLLSSYPLSASDWIARFRKSTYKNWQICKALCEQAIVSGIGNYLKAEILYFAQIKPDRTVSELSDKDLTMLYEVSIYKIKESHSHGGLTVRSYWSPSGKKGMFPTSVYEKTHDPNGYVVVKDKFKDDRTTHWVREIQR